LGTNGVNGVNGASRLNGDQPRVNGILSSAHGPATTNTNDGNYRSPIDDTRDVGSMQRTNGTRSTAGDHSSTATSLHNHHSAHSSRFTAAGSRQETKAALAPRAPSPQSRTVDQLPNSIQSASRTNDVSSQVNSSPQLASPPHEGRNLNHSGDHQFRSNQNGLSPTTSHSNATADIPSGLTFQSLTTPVEVMPPIQVREAAITQ